ncbi:thioredoxin reductase (NADPH) [Sphingobium sp. OAS761]|uniref:NAD(P)/FAD-dependent oxidoreductase n=1 Tax=Sphingobium sp. OAS761 TaxID=2817901 RepID=UPI00209CB6BD|nr:NAD(P)/FAD-dependent oxidoreductase [Sphingobium sp. OAS761]MCP1471981.1 thioredoxin reductase (NADPH) [Sphingobium sp. OAS761]
MYDCVIIGGGPAGLTAATYLGRFLRRTLLVDAGGGRAARIPRTHNLLGFPEGISGEELLLRMHQHAARYGAELVSGIVHNIARAETGFVVDMGARPVEARTLLLAQGVTNHQPRLAAEVHDHAVSRGLIRYCPVCDGFEVRGKSVAVLGCSDHGAAEARFIRRYSDTVALLTQEASQLSGSDEGDLVRSGIVVQRAPIHTLSVSDDAILASLVDGPSLRFDTLYVALGTSARSELARMAGAELSASGCIIVDEHQQTTIDGLFAAGDIVEGLDQIAVAAGQAAKAATAIHNRLSG